MVFGMVCGVGCWLLKSCEVVVIRWLFLSCCVMILVLVLMNMCRLFLMYWMGVGMGRWCWLGICWVGLLFLWWCSVWLVREGLCSGWFCWCCCYWCWVVVFVSCVWLSWIGLCLVMVWVRFVMMMVWVVGNFRLLLLWCIWMFYYNWLSGLLFSYVVNIGWCWMKLFCWLCGWWWRW